ncbi:hypothetical protein TrST_g2537 [Triparma strigata]|uniref:Uncharacterized protein n=1 Tax=Triparma strigata TaxID=1606541 RepID=A0A9W7AMV4_9STRA|nr:hypothetical protein TrST_g2537 [Triparma strigata]
MLLLILALAYLPAITGFTIPDQENWKCDDSVNFVDGISYNQISLTDGCMPDASGTMVCDANPVYVPLVAPFHSTDAATYYCQSLCSSAEEMANIGLTSSTSCSPCTGFFFQRHTNGHEICGFYTADMNDQYLEFSNHGHDDGSRVCVKSKFQIAFTVPSAMTEEESHLVSQHIVANELAWPDCSLNEEFTVLTTTDDSTTSQTLKFRVDTASVPLAASDMLDAVHDFFGLIEVGALTECHGHCGPFGDGPCGQQPDLVWYCEGCNCKDYNDRDESSDVSGLIEVGGHRLRLLQASLPDTESDVGIVDSCLEGYDCEAFNLSPKSEISSYCEGVECDKWECCSFDPDIECEIDEDCPQDYMCDKSPPPSSLRRKLFGNLEIATGRCTQE